MALNLQNKYPGRFDPVSADYPQGKFKNRSSPTAQDGSYMERDWLNDWAGFFGALLSGAGITPNGSVDTARSSQIYDALLASVHPVGAPIPWPTAVPPTGFITMAGQSFDPAIHPKLALAYPNHVLPDLRAFVIRGWDAGRNIDSGRTLLTAQNDAGRRIVGSIEIGANYRESYTADGCTNVINSSVNHIK